MLSLGGTQRQGLLAMFAGSTPTTPRAAPLGGDDDSEGDESEQEGGKPRRRPRPFGDKTLRAHLASVRDEGRRVAMQSTFVKKAAAEVKA